MGKGPRVYPSGQRSRGGNISSGLRNRAARSGTRRTTTCPPGSRLRAVRSSRSGPLHVVYDLAAHSHLASRQRAVGRQHPPRGRVCRTITRPGRLKRRSSKASRATDGQCATGRMPFSSMAARWKARLGGPRTVGGPTRAARPPSPDVAVVGAVRAALYGSARSPPAVATAAPSMEQCALDDAGRRTRGRHRGSPTPRRHWNPRLLDPSPGGKTSRSRRRAFVHYARQPARPRAARQQRHSGGSADDASHGTISPGQGSRKPGRERPLTADSERSPSARPPLLKGSRVSW